MTRELHTALADLVLFFNVSASSAGNPLTKSASERPNPPTRRSADTWATTTGSGAPRPAGTTPLPSCGWSTHAQTRDGRARILYVYNIALDMGLKKNWGLGT